MIVTVVRNIAEKSVAHFSAEPATTFQFLLKANPFTWIVIEDRCAEAGRELALRTEQQAIAQLVLLI